MIVRLLRQLWISAARVLCLTLAVILSVCAAPGAGNTSLLANPQRAVASSYSYDGLPSTSRPMFTATAASTGIHTLWATPSGAGAGGVSAVLAGSVAADTAATGGRSVDEVLNSLPKGKQSFVRTVPDKQTLQSTYGELTRGGTPTIWKGYNGKVFELQDGTQIGMRGTSSSGGSTIDIRVPGQDPFKIHIG